MILILQNNQMWFGLLLCNLAGVRFTGPVIPALEVNADLVRRLQITEHNSSQAPLRLRGVGAVGLNWGTF